MTKNKKKKANKKLNWQNRLYNKVVNGKPMSQAVHWTLIGSIAGLYAVKMADAAVILNNIGH